MTPNQETVAGAMAALLSTTPEEPLGKLLNLCLVSKVEGNATEKAKEFFDRKTKLSYWLSEVIGADGEYTPDEWLALRDVDARDTEPFVKKLLPEIEALRL